MLLSKFVLWNNLGVYENRNPSKGNQRKIYTETHVGKKHLSKATLNGIKHGFINKNNGKSFLWINYPPSNSN